MTGWSMENYLTYYSRLLLYLRQITVRPDIVFNAEQDPWAPQWPTEK